MSNKQNHNASYLDRILNEMKGIMAFIVAIWFCFLLDIILPLEQLGLVPRTLSGLVGILTMPFLHVDIQHLISNSIPLFVLLCLLAGSRSSSFKTVIAIAFTGGLLLWFFGRSAVHIGASGLIFGLMSFLIAAGYFERQLKSIAIAMLVGFLYGGTLFSGMIPKSGVSWDGHLFGALAGILIAYQQFHHAKKTRSKHT